MPFVCTNIGMYKTRVADIHGMDLVLEINSASVCIIKHKYE